MSNEQCLENTELQLLQWALLRCLKSQCLCLLNTGPLCCCGLICLNMSSLMMKWRIFKTFNFMVAFLCTRLGKRGKTRSSQFRICFCFYLTLFLLCDGNMSGKLGSQHQLFGIIVWIIFRFKWYETVVRNEHLFMLIKWVFHSIHLFWLNIPVHVIAQNVHFSEW